MAVFKPDFNVFKPTTTSLHVSSTFDFKPSAHTLPTVSSLNIPNSTTPPHLNLSSHFSSSSNHFALNIPSLPSLNHTSIAPPAIANAEPHTAKVISTQIGATEPYVQPHAAEFVKFALLNPAKSVAGFFNAKGGSDPLNQSANTPHQAVANLLNDATEKAGNILEIALNSLNPKLSKDPLNQNSKAPDLGNLLAHLGNVAKDPVTYGLIGSIVSPLAKLEDPLPIGKAGKLVGLMAGTKPSFAGSINPEYFPARTGGSLRGKTGTYGHQDHNTPDGTPAPHDGKSLLDEILAKTTVARRYETSSWRLDADGLEASARREADGLMNAILRRSERTPDQRALDDALEAMAPTKSPLDRYRDLVTSGRARLNDLATTANSRKKELDNTLDAINRESYLWLKNGKTASGNSPKYPLQEDGSLHPWDVTDEKQALLNRLDKQLTDYRDAVVTKRNHEIDVRHHEEVVRANGWDNTAFAGKVQHLKNIAERESFLKKYNLGDSADEDILAYIVKSYGDRAGVDRYRALNKEISTYETNNSRAMKTIMSEATKDIEISNFELTRRQVDITLKANGRKSTEVPDISPSGYNVTHSPSTAQPSVQSLATDTAGDDFARLLGMPRSE